MFIHGEPFWPDRAKMSEDLDLKSVSKQYAYLHNVHPFLNLEKMVLK